jgi:phosphatidylserine/phosphatidylglycerophosphate/cardiolipin synthase-like enzyme
VSVLDDAAGLADLIEEGNERLKKVKEVARRIEELGATVWPDRSLARRAVHGELTQHRLLCRLRCFEGLRSPRFSPAHAAWYFKSKGVDIDKWLLAIENHHTKGMIVDGMRVLIGSHNWSKPGISMNRDASLILDDADIAGTTRTSSRWNGNAATRCTHGDFSGPNR